MTRNNTDGVVGVAHLVLARRELEEALNGLAAVLDPSYRGQTIADALREIGSGTSLPPELVKQLEGLQQVSNRAIHARKAAPNDVTERIAESIERTVKEVKSFTADRHRVRSRTLHEVRRIDLGAVSQIADVGIRVEQALSEGALFEFRVRSRAPDGAGFVSHLGEVFVEEDFTGRVSLAPDRVFTLVGEGKTLGVYSDVRQGDPFDVTYLVS